MSDSDKVSDSNIEFIKTGWETLMTLCSSSVWWIQILESLTLSRSDVRADEPLNVGLG